MYFLSARDRKKIAKTINKGGALWTKLFVILFISLLA